MRLSRRSKMLHKGRGDRRRGPDAAEVVRRSSESWNHGHSHHGSRSRRHRICRAHRPPAVAGARALREAERGTDVLFSPYDTLTRDRYVVRADRQVVRTSTRGRVFLTPEELEAVPFLRQSTRDYLFRGTSFDLDFVLRSFAAVPGLSSVREVTSGYKPWWIDSISSAARESRWLPPEDVAELEHFLVRILRGSAWPGASAAQPPLANTFPVLPEDDQDHRMAILDEGETFRLSDLLGRLLQWDGRFAVPPPLGESEDEGSPTWDEFVREMIGRFVRSAEPPTENVHLVTFIG